MMMMLAALVVREVETEKEDNKTEKYIKKPKTVMIYGT